MTCIAGIAQDGKVWIGSDSAGVNDRNELQLRADAKIFRFGQMLIGSSGSWRATQRIKYSSPDILETISKERDAHEYMVNSFLPALQKMDIEHEDFELLVGFHGRLFHVYGLRQVSEEIASYECCGSGSQVARGALFATEGEPHISPPVRIKLALQAAERFNSGVRGPFVIMEL
jgi:hypothetical protein